MPLHFFQNTQQGNRLRAQTRVREWRLRVLAHGGSDPQTTSDVIPALIDFCEGVENAGLWGKIHQLNPFVGGNIDSHSVCLVGENMTSTAGIIHSANGAQGVNSLNQWMRTNTNPDTLYSGETRNSGVIVGVNIVAGGANGALYGITGFSGRVNWEVREFGGGSNWSLQQGSLSHSVTRQVGLYGNFVASDGSTLSYRDTTLLQDSDTVAAGERPPSPNMYLFNYWSMQFSVTSGGRSNRIYFWAFTEGLTAAEWLTLNTLVANLQTDLGR